MISKGKGLFRSDRALLSGDKWHGGQCCGWGGTGVPREAKECKGLKTKRGSLQRLSVSQGSLEEQNWYDEDGLKRVDWVGLHKMVGVVQHWLPCPR